MALVIGLSVLIFLPICSGFAARKNGKSFIGAFILHFIVIIVATNLGARIAFNIFAQEHTAASIAACINVLAMFGPIAIASRRKPKLSKVSKEPDPIFNTADFNEFKERYSQLSSDDLKKLLDEGGLRPEAEKALAESMEQQST